MTVQRYIRNDIQNLRHEIGVDQEAIRREMEIARQNVKDVDKRVKFVERFVIAWMIATVLVFINQIIWG